MLANYEMTRVSEKMFRSFSTPHLYRQKILFCKYQSREKSEKFFESVLFGKN